ncbi:DUF6179 domain-containing protein [Konateibacter massiliensis]|uniref:DUF6179 domain-containing protein n=1 Tax=Konateibacter massiliensis TaxID=2002841 RepID=UPI000C15F493|nr:DUF6179 domain-containing protein [Konateibacter massiliensis]
MNYEMEELVPIVSKLANKLTGYESTSITYEKAEQLMEAVIYCIHELELSREELSLPVEQLSAERAYERGYDCVKEKVKRALDSYHAFLNEFDSYENACLYDTFIKGIPEFFKWYDTKFKPQDTILTLDYPVLKDISMYNGIDAVYEFIDCVRLEQRFLGNFSKSYVKNVLRRYSSDYKKIIENICQIVFMNVIGHVLVGKPLEEQDFTEQEFEQIKILFRRSDRQEIKDKLKHFTERLVYQYYGEDKELWSYLLLSVDNIAAWLENAAIHNTLEQLFGN